MTDDIFDEFLDDNEEDVEEFDIQPRVLKKRETNKPQCVYVEYDRLTYNITAISPTKITTSTRRSLIITIEPSQLTTKLFENKIPLSKLKVKKNTDNGKFELLFNKSRRKGEFDFVFATKEERSYIHLVCDVISKNIHITFSSEIFKQNFTIEKITEQDLEELPEYIEIYCIDKNERSRLFGKFTINSKKLFEAHELTYKCPWLPDNIDRLKEIGFVYYNDNQLISVGYETTNELPSTNNFSFKPNLVYKQQGNVLKLQSNIKDINSYRLSNNIELFLYQKNDPAKMIGSIKLKSELLNNYNQFDIELKTEKEVKLLCNYFHLHTEEENANTYQQL